MTPNRPESLFVTRLPDGSVPDRPGQFSWHLTADARRLYVMLPCGHTVGLPVQEAALLTFWWWNHDENTPTLTPSILCRMNPEREDGRCWHGFLTLGWLRAA